MSENRKSVSGKGEQIKKKRLASLDALRGFDIFFLCCVCPIFAALSAGPLKDFVTHTSFGIELARHFRHVAWEGFVAHDLIMPLFLFMTGITIPFQFAKYKLKAEQFDRSKVTLRIIRRVALLWLCGMIAQGGLLDMDLQKLDFFSNTLQAIAIGYLISSILYLCFRARIQIVLFFFLLVAFWGLCTYVKVGNFGGGDFTPAHNLAEWLDQVVLGRWRDNVVYAGDGTWRFDPNYQYTWILSSLTFAATVLSGTLAGELIRRNPMTSFGGKAVGSESVSDVPNVPVGTSGHLVFLYLLLIGIGMAAVGYLWGQVPQEMFGYCPLIKKIWSPSMVLFSSGLSFILLAFFYEVIDVLNFKWGTKILILFGMNSITAYMLTHLPAKAQIQSVVSGLLYGTERHLSGWYSTEIQIISAIILTWLLWKMFKHGKFIRL